MNYVLNALDVLVEYPELMAYIKDFDGPYGFMFTEGPYEKQLDALLDSNGMHSGGSWGCMLRGVQAVLTGVLTRADVVAKIAEEDRKMAEWKAARKEAAEEERKYAEWRAARKEAAEAEEAEAAEAAAQAD